MCCSEKQAARRRWVVSLEAALAYAFRQFSWVKHLPPPLFDPAAEAVSLVAAERAELCRMELITLVREVLGLTPSTFQHFGFLGCRTAGF
jgi:hypothetical protein